MPTEQWARLRRENPDGLQAMLDSTADADPNRSPYETEKYRKELVSKVASNMLSEANDAGLLDDAAYVEQMHKFKALPRELYNPANPGELLASHDHIAADMHAQRYAQQYGVDWKPGESINEQRPRDGKGRFIDSIEVDHAAAANWKANADHGRA